MAQTSTVVPIRAKAKGPLVVGDREKELQYRPTTEGWTPERVKAAGADADSGSLQVLADLVETMQADDRIDGVTSTRTHGLLGLPLQFISGNPEAKVLLEGKDKGAPGEWWKMHGEDELVSLLAWGLHMGVGLAQRVPLPRLAGQIQKYRIETWSPRWLRYDPSARGGKAEWYVTTSRGEIPIVPGNGRWIVFTPYGRKRPWAKGKWRALAFPWLLKRFALEDRANHSETLGTPTQLGKAPKGATEKQRNKFLSQLVSLGKRGKIVLPEGWDLVLREAVGRTWEIYSDAISWADAAITIILAGQVVTTEGSPGFNSGNVQERIVGDLIRFDAERLSTCLQEQSLTPWVFENWQDPNAPWPHWKTERPPDLEQRARTLEILGRAIEQANKNLAPDNKRVNAVESYEQLGLILVTVPVNEAKPQTKLGLAPTDVAKAIKLNEVRASEGLPPLLTKEGAEDPRGDLLMSEAAVVTAGPNTGVPGQGAPNQGLPGQAPKQDAPLTPEKPMLTEEPSGST